MNRSLIATFTAGLLLAVFFLAGPGQGLAAEKLSAFNGVVVNIIDGDSLVVRKKRRLIKVRLHQVDCPETKQPFGREAKRVVRKLAEGQLIRVENPVWDPYYKGRIRGSVILPDGRDLGMELVKQGLAWRYPRYASNPLIADLEKEARQQKLGVWSVPNSTPPWEYRRARYKKQ